MIAILLGIILGLIGVFLCWGSYYLQNIDAWEKQGYARAKTGEEKVNRIDGFLNWKSKKVWLSSLGFLLFFGIVFSSQLVLKIFQIQGVDSVDVVWVQFPITFGLIWPGIIIIHLVVDQRLRTKN